jgi:hypothetical protein
MGDDASHAYIRKIAGHWTHVHAKWNCKETVSQAVMPNDLSVASP